MTPEEALLKQYELREEIEAQKIKEAIVSDLIKRKLWAELSLRLKEGCETSEEWRDVIYLANVLHPFRMLIPEYFRSVKILERRLYNEGKGKLFKGPVARKPNSK